MIIDVKETIYQGIILQRVEDQGWRCQLGENEYLFPTFVDAQSAINEIFRDANPIIDKYKGKKFKGELHTIVDAAIDMLRDTAE